MQALTLGILAALAWGLHDLCVRYVSQRTGVVPALLTVLGAGAVFVLPFAVLMGDWQDMTAAAYWLSAASGVVFALGTLSLYLAFAIGPVRLVAPIIGAYPALSVGWAALSGAAIGADQWLAVLVVILGVAVIARLTEDEPGAAPRMRAVLWSILAGMGFAGTFALGQAATRAGADLPVILTTRAISIATICVVFLLARSGKRLDPQQLPLLFVMGALDALALGLVLTAGSLPHPEYAAVASSLFGLVTILLAWAFLRERMTAGQWGSVLVVFAGIGYLAL